MGELLDDKPATDGRRIAERDGHSVPNYYARQEFTGTKTLGPSSWTERPPSRLVHEQQYATLSSRAGPTRADSRRYDGPCDRSRGSVPARLERAGREPGCEDPGLVVGTDPVVHGRDDAGAFSSFGLNDYVPVSACAAWTGFDSGEPCWRSTIESSTMAAMARNSDCQF